MAYHHPHPHPHHQNHHISTTTNSYCYCQPPPPPPPPCHHPPPQSTPFPTTTTTPTDPYLVASIVTQLLQQSPQHIKTKTPNQRHNLFDPLLLSLIERIDNLEASIQRYSCGSGTRTGTHYSLRDGAASVIQAHYRAHLVHRSRTLAHLQDLASIKSSLASLKSSLSRHGFVDFDFLSHKAMDLLLHLDSIQSGNKMIKDSKRSVTKEIVEFLDLLDGVCVKRHQVLTRKVKNLRLVRNDNRGARDTRGLSQHNGGLKSRNVGGEEKKLIANLRERVEKIGKMTKALEEQEDEVYGNAEIKGFKHFNDEDEDDIDDEITGSYGLRNGLNTKKNAQTSNAKKRVCFVEDGNVIKFVDIAGGSGSASRLVEVIEDPNKGSHDEDEATSDGDGSSHSSENMRKCRSDEVSEECDNLDEDFTFSNPELAKLDSRTDFMSRKSGAKIAG